MSSVGEFASNALREEIAPVASGINVQDRIRLAARRLGWSYTRTKDAWYGDPRMRLDFNEVRKIEEVSGIRYGRQEVRDIEDIIARADALLDGADPDFHGPFVAAMRSFFRAVGGARTEG